MESLFEKHQQKIAATNLTFIRSFMDEIDWNERLIGIKGARGIGKTTLLLQHIKKEWKFSRRVLYVSLDNIWFSENRLVHLAEKFSKQGGTHLFLDEVHKYPNWAQEIKNIYDDQPELNVVFTSSSLLEIINAKADLSRRTATYHMQGFSFREFLNLTEGTNFSAVNLNDLITNHIELSHSIVEQIKPLQHFDEYLKLGYYPFFREGKNRFHQKLEEVINLILEIELPQLRQVDTAYIIKLKQLLYIISESVPFTPNVSKLSERMGINRNTLLSYIHFLGEAELIHNIFKQGEGISRFQKPNKIFLNDSNINYALTPSKTEVGTLRETFFANQLKHRHQVNFPSKGDFLIDGKWLFEVGGKNKNSQQIAKIPNSYIAADDIEFGTDRKIPLWLFGFMY